MVARIHGKTVLRRRILGRAILETDLTLAAFSAFVCRYKADCGIFQPSYFRRAGNQICQVVWLVQNEMSNFGRRLVAGFSHKWAATSRAYAMSHT